MDGERLLKWQRRSGAALSGVDKPRAQRQSHRLLAPTAHERGPWIRGDARADSDESSKDSQSSRDDIRKLTTAEAKLIESLVKLWRKWSCEGQPFSSTARIYDECNVSLLKFRGIKLTSRCLTSSSKEPGPDYLGDITSSNSEVV